MNDDAQPTPFSDVDELEAALSRPPPWLIERMAELDGDMLVLGAAGKMGPTLTTMAKRASDEAGASRRIIAVSRFSRPTARAALEAVGVETIAGDLLDERFVASLPDAPLVVFMAGMKFGASGREARTWAMNAYVPALVSRRFTDSRIAVFSTGNVYGTTPVTSGGSREGDAVRPIGEYAMSCLGRERIFEHFSREHGTPVSIIRLNYACEMRYGVIVDLARKILAGEPIDLTMGYVNAIWQADANAMALGALAHAASPPFVVNLTGPERLRVREVARRLAEWMDKPVRFVGDEAPDALLSDASRAFELFGPPAVNAAPLIAWTANWIARGGQTLDKPTKFEIRDGRF